jgi:curved DNA-binding protein CbpA
MMTMTSSGIEPQRGPARERAPNLTSSDPYAVLGLVRGASPREIKRAYFDLVRQYPPEQRPDAFKLIRAAYEKLRTADAKAETDLFLFQPPSPWEPRKRKGKIDLDVHAEDIWLLLQQHGDLGRADFESDCRPVELSTTPR